MRLFLIPALIAPLCVAAFASIAAAQAVIPKQPDEVKQSRLPGPGERVMIRVQPHLAPSLAEAARPSTPSAAELLPPIEEEAVWALTAPPNNACAQATVISGTTTIAFDTTMATTDGQPHFLCNFFGQPQIANDVWFRWQAPVTARFTADTCTGTNFDTKIAVYNTQTCLPSEFFLLGCNDDACGVQSRVAFNATAQQWYLIRVGNFPGSTGGTGVLRMAFDSAQNVCGYGPANCQTRDNSNAFDATGRRMLDDFTPKFNGFINGVCFWGAYFDGSGDCESTSIDQFQISYFFDVAGVPDDEPFMKFEPGQYQMTGPVPTGILINGSFPEYSYHVSHAPVQVYADVCYWVSIENRLPPPPNGFCAWYWERGGGGNMIGYRNNLRIDEDLAFCLSMALDPPTECNIAAPPSNDQCSGAIPLMCNFTQFNQDNLFATTSINDPVFTCRFDGPEQGVATLWYRFTAQQTSARVTLCNNSDADTLLGIYSGTCGNLTQIACNDDFCGFKSQVCAFGLTVGQQYYIQLASYDVTSRGTFQLTLNCPCPPPPANDLCGGATLLSIPANVFGSTANATLDSTVPVCGFSLISSPGVWYRVVGNGRTITASLCSGTVFDTKLSVFCGSCTDLVCVANNDDDCGIQSRVSWCSENGRTYWILVHGFAGSLGDFQLIVGSNAVTCSTAVSCETCSLTCPIGSIQETETCGGDTNGGCNVSPVAVQPIQCGQRVCGTMFNTGYIRDTDWYQFNISLPSVVTWSVQSEPPVEVFLLTDTCPPSILGNGSTDRCGTATATALLQPGTYRAFIGAIGDGYPCGAGANDYIATLTCGAVGACCTVDDCTRLPGNQCVAPGSFYAGDGSTCPINYNVTTCGNAFEDILAGGITILLGINEGASIPIPFPFKFYGVVHSNVNVSSNGYLTFDGFAGDPVNRPIPSLTTPNGIIAPFWDSLAPNSGSGIRYLVQGTAPARRLIVQWTNVPQFLQSDSNTFQAILFEGTNCIEFRYGAFTPEAMPGDYTIGVENHSGVSGTSIDPATLSQGSCVRLCPVLAPGGCQAITACPGDANGDRVVNFSDIVTVLTYWGISGPPGSPGDATGDGLVNFSDITRVLENWAMTCPH